MAPQTTVPRAHGEHTHRPCLLLPLQLGGSVKRAGKKPGCGEGKPGIRGNPAGAGRDPGICPRGAGQPANSGVGLGGKGTARLPGPSQPSPSQSPPQGLAVFRDKGPLRPQTQLGEGNSGDQSYFGIFRLKIFQPRPAQAAHTPQRNRESAWNQESVPWTLGSHTATCNYTPMYTHLVFQVSHRHAHTHSSLRGHWCQLCACTPGVTHSPVYIHTGHLTHTFTFMQHSWVLTHTAHIHTCAHAEALVVLLWP